MSITIGCANPECKQPYSFILDETLGGARCPYCGVVNSLDVQNTPNGIERVSAVVEN